jgi:hypothetical protein
MPTAVFDMPGGRSLGPAEGASEAYALLTSTG